MYARTEFLYTVLLVASFLMEGSQATNQQARAVTFGTYLFSFLYHVPSDFAFISFCKCHSDCYSFLPHPSWTHKLCIYHFFLVIHRSCRTIDASSHKHRCSSIRTSLSDSFIFNHSFLFNDIKIILWILLLNNCHYWLAWPCTTNHTYHQPTINNAHLKLRSYRSLIRLEHRKRLSRMVCPLSNHFHSSGLPNHNSILRSHRNQYILSKRDTSHY